MLSDLARGAPAATPPDLADTLMSRYVGFAGWLRANGFHLTSSDVTGSMDVARVVGQTDRELLRWSLRAWMCSRAEEWRRFDELFDMYFLAPNRHALVETRTGGAGQIERSGAGEANDDSEGMPVSRTDTGGDVGQPGGRTAERGASTEASIAYADFRHLNQRDELFAIDGAIRRFVQRLRGIEIRRERRASAGRTIDMVRTIRRSVSHGGVPLELAWRRKQRKRPRIVLLLDVSRSMNLYSFFFLRLARVFGTRLSDVHPFIFHTRLVGVAQALRDPDPWRSQERLHLLSAGWAGGTRIGESLDEFNTRHAAALLHSRTAVVIVSDGYDAGDPDKLARALRRIRRRCRCIVWLNPLAGRPGYTPTSAGMSAALPHIDLMAGARDLASLEHVFPQVLARLQ